MAVFTGNYLQNTLTGSDYNDYIAGYGGNDNLSGGFGSDRIYGGSGDDVITGGPGNDFLFGETGDDEFVLGLFGNGSLPGADFVGGGAGRDVLNYAFAFFAGQIGDVPPPLVIDLADNSRNSGYAAESRFRSIEGVISSPGRDRIFGDAADNYFFASGGDDLFDGRGGLDSYYARALISLNPNQYILSFEVTYDPALQDGYAVLANVDYTIPRQTGEGLAFYTYWTDFNNDQIVDEGEKRYSADRLIDIERYVGLDNVNDTISGTDRDETFEGTGGSDKLNGGGGYDILSYARYGYAVEVDLLAGTAVKMLPPAVPAPPPAVDTVTGFEAVVGSGYGDQILGDNIANMLSGGGGGDALDGRDGADFLLGESGDDIVFGGSGDDLLVGGTGEDVIDGGAGSDTALFADSEVGVAVSLVSNTGLTWGAGGPADSDGDSFVSIENLFGSHYTDFLKGDDEVNIIQGGFGNQGDLIYGQGGDDFLYSGHVFEAAFPQLPVNPFDDFARPEVQELVSDEVYGGSGNDLILGDDRFIDVLVGEDGNDRIIGGAGVDAIDGGTGNDILIGGAGLDFIFGGFGRDTASYASSPEGVTIDLSGPRSNSGGDASSDLIVGIFEMLGRGASFGETFNSSLAFQFVATNPAASEQFAFPDFLIDVEDVVGSSFNDHIFGAADANRLTGGGGDDEIDGEAGADTLIGGVGNDSLVGGLGDDILIGGDGNDSLAGGEGRDTASYASAAGPVAISLSLTGPQNAGTSGNDTLAQVENLIGSGFSDQLTGNGLANRLDGGSGADAMAGLGGNDTYILDNLGDQVTELAGGGNDTVQSRLNYQLGAEVENLVLLGTAIVGNGNGVANLLMGSAGNNRLAGGDGADTLRGEAGDDMLRGGLKGDTLVGGGGADQFQYGGGDFVGIIADVADRIVDFNRAQGDKIDLSLIDAAAGVGTSDDVFIWKGTAAFTGTAGELRYQQGGGMTEVQGDTNGDGAADFLIRLDGTIALEANDFLL